MHKMTSRGLIKLICTGFASQLLGFIWGGVFAGVPYQEGTKEQDAHYLFHASVGLGFIGIGMILMLIGSTLLISKLWNKHIRKPPST
jgi:cytochrome bd-type quinol oxidase subunit 2